MKSFFILVFSFAWFLSVAQSGTFTVSGKIKGLDSKELRMVVLGDKLPNGYRVETIPVTNESFKYTGNIDTYSLITISPGVDRVVKKVGNGYIPVKSAVFVFIGFPGAKVEFTGEITDFVNAYPSGDPANNDLANLNKLIFPLMNKSVNIEVKIGTKKVEGEQLIAAMKDSANVYDNQVSEIKKHFIIENPSSVASAWVLSDMMMRGQIDAEKAIAAYEHLDKGLKENVFYKEVENRAKGLILTKPGNVFPDISSQRTPDSARFELSSLRGKYLIVDFWGTWCGPCMDGMPKMRTYLEKYPDKLNILGVASESDNGQKWKKTIESKNLSWYHVLSGKGEEDYVAKFSVSGFPTKFIIDPEGKIISRFVGEDESFYFELDKILK